MIRFHVLYMALVASFSICCFSSEDYLPWDIELLSSVAGRRGGHPIATTLPSSHARKDYGRMSWHRRLHEVTFTGRSNWLPAMKLYFEDVICLAFAISDGPYLGFGALCFIIIMLWLWHEDTIIYVILDFLVIKPWRCFHIFNYLQHVILDLSSCQALNGLIYSIYIQLFSLYSGGKFVVKTFSWMCFDSFSEVYRAWQVKEGEWSFVVGALHKNHSSR